MTCRKVKTLIPLFAGDDLRPGRARAVRSHIEDCPGCQRELEDYRQTLTRLKAAAKAERVPDWGEGEWKALITRATAGAGEAGEAMTGRGARILKPSWAAASVLGAFLCLIVLGVLFRGPSLQSGRTPSEGRTTRAAENAKQDKVTVTMVSPETGLQVVWFLDKNFDWKGDQE